MKSDFRKRAFGILAIIIFVLASLAGCGVNRDGDEESVPGGFMQQGIYTEQEIILPAAVREGNIVIVGFGQNRENGLELFLYDRDKESFGKYVLSEKNQWSETTCEWLNSIEEEIYAGLMRVSYADGQYYALYGDINGGYHLLCSSDEVIASEINMEGHHPVVNRIVALQNDTIAAMLSDGTCQIYKNGKLTDSFSGGEAYALAGSGKYAARYNDGNTGIYFYNIETEKIENEVYLTEQYQNVPQIFMKEENSIFLAGDIGIVKVDRESRESTTIVEPDQTMLSNAAYFPMWLEEGNGIIYVLFVNREQTNGRLIQYRQDKEGSISQLNGQNEKQLSVYGLYDNELIRTAVSNFKLEHPDIEIIYEVAGSAEGAMTESDLVRSLNARIAAGNGPDIFILDGLPIDSYVSRGILEDLSAALSESDVIPNLRAAYEKDGEIYAVPTRIGIPIIIGTQEVMKKINNRNDLADYADHAALPYFIEASVSYETILESFYPLYVNAIVEESRVNREELREFLGDMKKIADSVNAVEITDFDYSHPARWLARGNVSLAVCTLKGMLDDEATEQLSFAEQRGDYAVCDDLFEPYGLLGVYAGSGKKELAMEFVRTALRIEVQETEYRHGGFPVSMSALEKWRDTDSDRGGATMDPATGVQINFKWPDEVSRNRLFEEILSLKTPIACDQVVKERILSSATAYLKGEITIETAVQEIGNEVDLYLQE